MNLKNLHSIIAEHEFQIQLNQLLIETLLNKINSTDRGSITFTQNEIERIKSLAAKVTNHKFGEELVVFQKSEAKSPDETL